ncbi:hypothetical protein NRK67_16620 (plasmid) [Fusobacteria bacterium ZRK30]|nr:hypothetical protein NRK67_16620 [Fusobacteria bacterium ZRK30]
MKKYLLTIVIMLFITSFSFCKNRDSKHIQILMAKDSNHDYEKLNQIIDEYNNKNSTNKHIFDIEIINTEEGRYAFHYDNYILRDDSFHNFILNKINAEEIGYFFNIGRLYHLQSKNLKKKKNIYNQKLNGRYIKVNINGEIKEKLKFKDGIENPQKMHIY